MSVQTVLTKDVIEAYKMDMKENGMTHNIHAVDCPELYEYEEHLGKRVFDMTSEELTHMISSVYTKYETHYSVGIVISVLRGLFNFYINNFEVIVNPFLGREWKGKSAINRILSSRPDYRITKENFETMISCVRFYLENSPQKYLYNDYYECMLRLAYDGLICGAEYLEFREEDVDFENNTIQLQTRKIHISDRTADLLVKVHESDFRSEKFVSSNLRSYHGSYFKFICRNGYEKKFDESKPSAVVRAMTTKLNGVKDDSSSPYKYNYRELCTLGFYEYLKDKYGEMAVREMVLSERNMDYTRILAEEAEKYEIPLSQFTIKAELLRYI